MAFVVSFLVYPFFVSIGWLQLFCIISKRFLCRLFCIQASIAHLDYERVKSVVIVRGGLWCLIGVGLLFPNVQLLLGSGPFSGSSMPGYSEVSLYYSTLLFCVLVNCVQICLNEVIDSTLGLFVHNSFEVVLISRAREPFLVHPSH